jgi:hypothetical protein
MRSGSARRDRPSPRTSRQRSLVDDDRGGQVLDGVDVGPLVPGQLTADERGKGGIELALGFDRDRVEDDGRLAGAGHADKHRDLVLRDAQRHTLEVVLSAPTTRIVSQRSS